jgi:hypothetical protein
VDYFCTNCCFLNTYMICNLMPLFESLWNRSASQKLLPKYGFTGSHLAVSWFVV